MAGPEDGARLSRWGGRFPNMVIARATPRVMLLAFLSAACSNPADPTPAGRIRIVAGPAQSDTVSAQPAQPAQALVVEVRNAAGALASGTVVRFTPLAPAGHPNQFSRLVSSASGSAYSGFYADTTDTRGRIITLVQYGPVAGPGHIEVTVPEAGATVTVDYTIRAGAPASILITPEDTTVRPLAGREGRQPG